MSRFLNLPELKKLGRIADDDIHETGVKTIPQRHTLNDTSKLMLERFFHPFNKLLEDFLGDEFGYI